MLNAFRHQRFLHNVETGQAVRVFAVLNAFRHQRFLHHVVKRIASFRIVRCSTPFGIKDSCTAETRWQQAPNEVLNAFRHQRFLHLPTASLSLHALRGAQRLSASKIPAP